MRIDALADFMPVLAHCERRRLDDAIVEEMRPHLAADFDHVAKTLGSDQAGNRAAPLDDKIGRDRRAVADVSDVRWFD